MLVLHDEGFGAAVAQRLTALPSVTTRATRLNQLPDAEVARSQAHAAGYAFEPASETSERDFFIQAWGFVPAGGH
ncbi:hypothetical protein [Amycolatopsis sp. NPDC059657]|uniref:hypothetical protein n=1 Tax=Amycolatopsis sp. NPDC059657 TaxID=3346899 RepID=UPI00367079A7